MQTRTNFEMKMGPLACPQVAELRTHGWGAFGIGEEIVYDASALGSRYGYPRTLGLEVTYDLGGP